MTPDSGLTQQSGHRLTSMCLPERVIASTIRADAFAGDSPVCLDKTSYALRWSRNLRLSQPRNWHEPRAIAAVYSDVTALKTPHRLGNKANGDWRIGSAPSKRKGIDPDLDVRQPVCRFDSLDYSRPPTGLTKTNNPGVPSFNSLTSDGFIGLHPIIGTVDRDLRSKLDCRGQCLAL